MQSKLQIQVTPDQLSGVIHYVEQSIKAYEPDHDDVDLMLRMRVLKRLWTYLSKRQIEIQYQDRVKLTIPDVEALALLAQWQGDLSATPAYIALSVSKITSVAHKNWM